MSRIKHSFCRWCYGSIPLEDLCLAAKDIGIPSIELVVIQRCVSECITITVLVTFTFVFNMPRGSTSASGEKLWREKSSPELSRVLPLYVEEERVRSVPSGANSSGVGSPEVMSSICRQLCVVTKRPNFLEHGHFWNRSETLDPSSAPLRTRLASTESQSREKDI